MIDVLKRAVRHGWEISRRTKNGYILENFGGNCGGKKIYVDPHFGAVRSIRKK